MSPARRRASGTGRPRAKSARPPARKRPVAARASKRATPRSVRPGTPPTASAKPPAAAALAIACARAADEHLGLETLVFDLRGGSPIADWVVLTTASSSPHARAVAQAVTDAIQVAGRRLHHREGDPGSPWILLDASNVIIHVMDALSRRTYDLERLWAGAPRIDWRKPPLPRARG